MKHSEANEKFPEMVKQFPLPYWNLHPAIMGLVWAPQSLSQVSQKSFWILEELNIIWLILIFKSPLGSLMQKYGIICHDCSEMSPLSLI